MCYRTGPFLFLFPLEEVRHIIPADGGKDGQIEYEGNTAQVLDLGGLLGCDTGDLKPHVLLLECMESLYGISGGRAQGIVGIPREHIRELPKRLSARAARCLKAGVYLEEQEQWAYIVDTEGLIRTEGIKHEGDSESQGDRSTDGIVD